MSVIHQTIVLFGWEIGTDEYKKNNPDPDDDALFNPLSEEYGWRDRDVGEVGVIYDGMGGRYCYLGIVVAATNSTRDGEQCFDDRHRIDDLTPDGEVVGELTEVVDEYDIEVNGRPTTHIFTHVR